MQNEIIKVLYNSKRSFSPNEISKLTGIQIELLEPVIQSLKLKELVREIKGGNISTFQDDLFEITDQGRRFFLESLIKSETNQIVKHKENPTAKKNALLPKYDIRKTAIVVIKWIFSIIAAVLATYFCFRMGWL